MVIVRPSGPPQYGLFRAALTCRDSPARPLSRLFASGQTVSASKRVTLRVSALNSTPTKWIGSPLPR